MPTYEYECKNCGRRFIEIQNISDSKLTKCLKCGQDTLVRLISGGAGIIFNGSGFYCNDHKKVKK